jgi:hypothetical protein
MKFLMLVCWDARNMDAQTEPDPSDTANEESFPWLGSRWQPRHCRRRRGSRCTSRTTRQCHRSSADAPR